VALGAFMLHAEAAPSSFSAQALAQHFTTDVLAYVQQPGHLTRGAAPRAGPASSALEVGLGRPHVAGCAALHACASCSSCCSACGLTQLCAAHTGHPAAASQPPARLRLRARAAGGLFWQTDISPWFSNRAGLSAGLTSLMYVDMFQPDAGTAAQLTAFAQSQLDYVRPGRPRRPRAARLISLRPWRRVAWLHRTAAFSCVNRALHTALQRVARAGAGQQPQLRVVRARMRRAHARVRSAPPLQHELSGGQTEVSQGCTNGVNAHMQLQPSAERQRCFGTQLGLAGTHRAAARQPDCQPLRTCSGKPGEVQLNACQNDPPTNGIVLEGAMVGGPNHEQFTLPTPSWDPGHCSCAAHPIRPRILRPPWQSTCSSLQLAAQPC